MRERARVRVLVVEDNSVNQRVAARLLKKLGYACEVASSGQDALKALDGARFDLVLMDCQMPGMDGFECTGHIRAREATGGRRLAIVAMTANAMVGDRERCLEAGMDDYITKPIDLPELAAILERLARPGEPAPADAGAVLASIERFLEQAPRLLASLEQASDDASRTDVAKALSRLGSDVGARKLTELAERLRTGTGEDGELVEKIRSELANVRQALV
jgi:CheY-like chemotaxis protein